MIAKFVSVRVAREDKHLFSAQLLSNVIRVNTICVGGERGEYHGKWKLKEDSHNPKARSGEVEKGKMTEKEVSVQEVSMKRLRHWTPDQELSSKKVDLILFQFGFRRNPEDWERDSFLNHSKTKEIKGKICILGSNLFRDINFDFSLSNWTMDAKTGSGNRLCPDCVNHNHNRFG